MVWPIPNNPKPESNAPNSIINLKAPNSSGLKKRGKAKRIENAPIIVPI